MISPKKKHLSVIFSVIFLLNTTEAVTVATAVGLSSTNAGTGSTPQGPIAGNTSSTATQGNGNNNERLTVTGIATEWNPINIVDGDFTASLSGAGGSITAEHLGGSGGGNRDTTGSNFTSSVTFNVGVSESADYTFNLNYTQVTGTGNASTANLTWRLIFDPDGTASNEFSGTGSAGGTPVSITGNLSTPGTYRLEVIGSLTGSHRENAGNSFVTVNDLNFSVDSAIPEPSSMLLLSALGIFLFQRKRG